MKISIIQHHIIVTLLLILVLSELRADFSGSLEASSLSKVRRRRSSVCKKSQDLCGNVCYDYTYHSCQEGINRRKFLCYKDESACGDKCYDPYEYNCHGSGEDAIMCRWNERICGQKCYNPKHATCSRGKLDAKNNENRDIYSQVGPISSFSSMSSSSSSSGRDGGTRFVKDFGMDDIFSFGSFSNFNNNNRDKNDNNDYTTFTCPRNNLLCGFKCYDPSKQTCFRESSGSNSWTALCTIGHKRCGNQCYDPYRQSCSGNDDDNSFNSKLKFNLNSFTPSISSSSSNNDCPRGYLKCDGWCYNPFEEDCLANNKKNNNKNTITSASGDGFSRVNSRQEFSSSSSNFRFPSGSGSKIFDGSPSLSSTWCSTGQLKCGKSCYDPRREECLNSNNNNRGYSQQQRCESGQEACGSRCYDPFDQKCLDGNNGKVICRWNERACGNNCYDPFRENCN